MTLDAADRGRGEAAFPVDLGYQGIGTGSCLETRATRAFGLTNCSEPRHLATG